MGTVNEVVAGLAPLSGAKATAVHEAGLERSKKRMVSVDLR